MLPFKVTEKLDGYSEPNLSPSISIRMACCETGYLAVFVNFDNMICIPVFKFHTARAGVDINNTDSAAGGGNIRFVSFAGDIDV